MGWDRQYPQYLTNNGFPAYATAVGPFSSNFDRAVDLYYYIKGGYVDYGKFHSNHYGHHQKKAVTIPVCIPNGMPIIRCTSWAIVWVALPCGNY
ncbi:lipase [Paraflavitalea speifideaquila]|uniref:lipase-like domain-containing protein n=1 Tax=Paraflavitalea speifideaquila TaxID=3076558 RepID=UPI003CCCD9E3